MKIRIFSLVTSVGFVAIAPIAQAQSYWQQSYYTGGAPQGQINSATFQYPRVQPSAPTTPLYIQPTAGGGYQNSWGGYAVPQQGGAWSFFGNWGQKR